MTTHTLGGLSLSDLEYLGETALCGDAGNVFFTVDRYADCLLLRLVLATGGYSILSCDDFQWESGSVSVGVTTNMPWYVYVRLFGSGTTKGTDDDMS